MEATYRIFMYVLPYAVSAVLYGWVFRRARKVPHKVYRGVALALVVGGIGYTVYDIVKTAGAVFTDDNFHFQIMITTVVVLFLASIAMTLGEPEK